MINATVDSVYEEPDGRISVHVTIRAAGGEVLERVTKQVQKIEDLENALRAPITNNDAAEAKREALKAQAQAIVDALKQDAQTKRGVEVNDGADLDR